MNLALMIASIAASVIGADTNIPGQIKSIATAISSAIAALVKSGVTTSPVTASTILGAIQGVVDSLKALPGLPTQTLEIVSDLDQAVQAALKADALAVAGPVDPTLVKPEAPLP
jgi:phage-related protein